MRMLILTGGIGHPFADASEALVAILRDGGIAATVTEDIEGGIAGLASGGYDLVTVYALRWRMLTGEKYAPYRENWAFSLSPKARVGFSRFVAAGGGLLALHTAVICFDDWPGWGDLTGGAWVWGRSSHPPFGAVMVSPTTATHTITAGIAPFALYDEVYGDLDMRPGVEPLLIADVGYGPKPILWARQAGRGRVVTDLLGHDRAALEHPVHRELLLRSARWAGSRD